MFTSHAKFLAIEKHFKDPNYSIWESEPLSAPNKKSSRLRRMYNFFYNLHKTVPEREHFGLIVANFVRCGGQFDPQQLTKQELITHTKWKRRTQSLIYMIENELAMIQEKCDFRNTEKTNDDGLCESEVVSLALTGKLSPETLCFLEQQYNFVRDESLKNLCKKYAELLRVDTMKIKNRLKKRFK